VVLERGRVVDRIDMADPQPQSLLGKFFFETAGLDRPDGAASGRVMNISSRPSWSSPTCGRPR
jgi:hypothetical protein